MTDVKATAIIVSIFGVVSVSALIGGAVHQAVHAQVTPATVTTPSVELRFQDAAPTSVNLVTVAEIQTCFQSVKNHMQLAVNKAWTGRNDDIIEARNQIQRAAVMLSEAFDTRFESRLKRMEEHGAVNIAAPLRTERVALVALVDELKVIIYGGSEEESQALFFALLGFAETEEL